jgi:RHS repeat-associated protein
LLDLCIGDALRSDGEVERRAWGRVEKAEGVATPLRFQGQLEDGETGLFYNRFRYYDPEAGMYVSPDPIGLGGGLRPFGYGTNPAGWIDPLGLVVGPFGQVGGHHIHARSAFRGHCAYDQRAALAISHDEIRARGWDHDLMTAKQNQAFAEMRAGQRPNTMSGHDQVAREALVAGWLGGRRTPRAKAASPRCGATRWRRRAGR